MKVRHIRKVLLLVALTILLVGLASAATTNKTSTNKDTKIIKENTKTIKTTTAATKKASTKTVTNNKTQTNNKVKEKSSEKTTQNIEKNKQKNTKTEPAPISVTSWSDLQEKIGQISEDTTLRLKEGSSFETTDTITWSNTVHTLTIDGNGQTINGKQNQVFHINNGATLHLKNITITNAQTTATGTDANAYAFGGAIYNGGTLTITHSTLTNNTATATGTDANAYAEGGAIYNGGTLTIYNSTITNNTANATTTGTDADAYAIGGAIYNNGGTLNITHSTLQDNTANATTTGTYAYVYARGGAIYNNDGGTLNITHSTLQDNTATATGTREDAYAYAEGGAINNNGGTLNITHSTLQDNTANATTTATYTYAKAYGGAICNNGGTLNITHSTLQDNTANATTTGDNAAANAYGGAIYNSRTLTITHSTFTNNQATANATGENTYSYAYGGAINNDDETLNITHSTFTNNTVTATGEIKEALGGAIHNDNGNYNIIDTTFYKNTPANFIISGNKIQLEQTDGYISIGKFTIIADGEEIGKGTGEEFRDVTISDEYNNVELVINDTNDKTFNSRYILRRFNVEVHDYTELIEAIETAKNEAYNSYIINLLYGDYTATQNINWEESATKNLIIKGYNNIIDGKLEHQFIRIGKGLNLTLVNVILTNFKAEDGGAIFNQGNLTVIDSSFIKNTATNNGGAIYSENLLNITGSNFIQNSASSGAAIYFNGTEINLSGNLFALNIASVDGETLKLMGEALNIEDNTYESTDIGFKSLNLSVKDYHEYLLLGKNVALNFTIELEHPTSYDTNIQEKLDKTIYINRIENVTTKYNNFTLSNLELGSYNINFMINRYLSNTITFYVVEYDSEVSTSESVYGYYDGLKNNVTINIKDESGKKGTITISVKDNDKYYTLLIYPNIKDKHTLTTETIADALKTLYENLDDSYTINVTYASDNVVPNSTEFTLNIIKQRNTTIIYNILNNTEGNVQINITLIDTITKTPIETAIIKITGAINKNTASGIITDTTLTPGSYTIKVTYDETENYKHSEATINFNVEIDKDKKIEEQDTNIKELENNNKELENKVEKLTQKTKTKLTISTTTATIGKTITIKVTVKDSNNKAVNGGKVTIKVNGVVLKDSSDNIISADVNKATATINYLVPNTWINSQPTIEATYTGNDKYDDSTITKSGLIKVQKGSSKITLTPNIKTVKAGQKVTINVKHVDYNTNQGLTSTVTVKVNGKTYKVKVKNGEGKLTYTVPKGTDAKTIKITATRTDKYYNKVTGKTSFKVTKTTPAIKTTKTTYKSKKTTIKGKILDANNKALTKNVKVTVKVDGKIVLKNKIVKKGKISLSFKKSLKKGYHELSITSKATKAFNKASYTSVLKV